jgi:hypothetical protein
MQLSLRRLVLGAAVAGATIAAAPALASASSTCTIGSGQAVIMDGSGSQTLHVSHDGPYIKYADGSATPWFCIGPGGALARTDKLDLVYIQGPAVGPYDTIDIDETNGVFGPGATTEATGESELEFDALTTGGGKYLLSVHGTPKGDVFKVGGAGFVDLNDDGDTDVTVEGGASGVELHGGGGYDTFDGRGAGKLGPATVPEWMYGGSADDVFYAGREHNYVYGYGGNDDFYLSANGYPDSFEGGDGYDRAFTDTFDIGFAEARYNQNH